MRGLIVMAMFVASLAHAAWKDYSEVRDLELDAAGIGLLEMDTGAGSMDVKGAEGLDRIVVKATIVVSDTDDDDAAKLLDKKMKLSLDSRGDRAKLVADFDSGVFGSPDARIDLQVSIPSGMAVHIDDGSGSISVMDTLAAIVIDDGSGSIDVRNVAGVEIDDGSGSIDIEMASGDVSITDGSGSIAVRSVSGSVTIDDGSGGIDVSDVEHDLIIVDDGSGSLSFTDVRGRVDHDS